MRTREELIRLIVEAHFPLDPLRAELAAYPWDADEPLVMLRADHIRRVLKRYLGGELTAAQVQRWAEAVELRDDVDFDNDNTSDLERAIFILANPDVNGQLTRAMAADLVARLDGPTA